MSGAREAAAAMSSVEGAREALDGKRATVEVDQDGAALTERAIYSVERAARSLDGRTVTLAIGGAATVAGALAARQAIVSLGERLDLLSRTVASLRAQAMPLGLSLLPALSAAALSAASATGSLAVSLGEGAAGFAAIGGAAYGAAAGGLAAYASGLKAVISASREAYEATHQQRVEQLEKQRQDILNTQASLRLNAAIDRFTLSLTRLSAAVGRSSFPLLTRELAAWDGVLVRMTPRLAQTSGQITRLAAGFSRFVRSAQGGSLVGRTLDFVADSALMAARALAGIGRVGVSWAPLLIEPARRLAERVFSLVSAFTRWAASMRGTRTAAAWVGVFERQMHTLVDIALDAARVVGNLISALHSTGVGDRMLAGIRDFVSYLAQATQRGGAAARAIAQFARSGGVLLGEAARTAGVLFRELVRVAQAALDFRAAGQKSTVLVNIFRALRSQIGPVASMLIDTFRQLGPLLPPLIRNLGGLFSTFGGQTPVLRLYLTALNNLLAAFNRLPGPVKSVVVNMVALSQVMQTTSGVSLGGLITGIVGAYTQWRIYGAVTRMAAASTGAAAASQRGLTASMVAQRAAALAAAAATRVWTVAQRALNLVLRANPIGIVITALAALAAALVYAYRHSETFRRVVNATFAWLRGAGVAAVRTLWSALRAAWTWIRTQTPAAWNAARGAISASVRAILAVVRAAWGAIRAATTSVFGAIRTFLAAWWAGQRAAASVAARAIQAAVSAAWRTLSAVTRAVFGGIRAFLAAWWAGQRALFAAATSALRQVVTSAWNAIRAVTASVWNAIRALLRATWDAILSVARAALAALRSAITSAWNAIRAVTTSAWNAIESTVGSRIRSAADRVRSVVGQLRSWLSEAWEGIKRAASAAWEAISGRMWRPIETAYNKIVEFINKIIGVINAILEKVGLPTIGKLEAAGTGPGGNPRFPGRPTGGNAAGPGGAGPLRRFARGGLARPHRPSVHVWGEGDAPEAFITADRRYRRDNERYAKIAASWLGGFYISSEELRRWPKTLVRGGVPVHMHARGEVLGVPGGQVIADYQQYIPGYRFSSDSRHKGVDVAQSTGTPVHAPAAGRVLYGGPGGGAYSNYVGTTYLAKSGRQYWMHSGHLLSGSPLPSGATFKPGQVIGKIGTSADAAGTTPHVHHQSYRTQAGYDSFTQSEAAGLMSPWEMWRAVGGATEIPSGAGGAGFNPMLALFERLWRRLVEPIVDRMLSPLLDADYVLLRAAGRLAKKVPEGIYNKIVEKLSANVGANVPVKGELRDWARQGLGIGGAFPPTESNIQKIVDRAMQESGGDPYAVNNWDSNAAAGTPSKGLMQIIEPTWESYRATYGADMGPFDKNWMNPIKSVAVASRYMKSRYGYVVGATGTGYEKGGMIPGRPGDPKVLLAHAGEIVLPQGVSKAFIEFSESLREAARRAARPHRTGRTPLPEGLAGGEGVRARPPAMPAAASRARAEAEALERRLERQAERFEAAMERFAERLEASLRRGIKADVANVQEMVEMAFAAQESPRGRKQLERNLRREFGRWLDKYA